MARGKVFQSSHLERVINYNSDTGSLTLEFTNGSQYTYSSVPMKVYWQLTKSASPGEFFAKNIRGSYGYAKI